LLNFLHQYISSLVAFSWHVASSPLDNKAAGNDRKSTRCQWRPILLILMCLDYGSVPTRTQVRNNLSIVGYDCEYVMYNKSDHKSESSVCRRQRIVMRRSHWREKEFDSLSHWVLLPV